MRKAQAWINKKLRSGVSKKELYHSVGAFSNKKKSKVMAQKGLSSQDYDKRYNFLYKVFCLLERDR